MGIDLVVALVLVSTLQVPSSPRQTGEFTSPFSSETLELWDVGLGVQRTAPVPPDGLFRIGEASGWVMAPGAYHDFVLRFEARADPGAIGGVVVRVLPTDGQPVGGYEVRIAEGGHPSASLLLWRAGTVVRAERGWVHTTPSTDWQAFRVEAQGSTLRVLANGEPVQDFTGLVQNVGRLGLHVERGTIEFRSVEIERKPFPSRRSVAGAFLPDEDGVTKPVPVREYKPLYTRRAMADGVEGEVWVQCVVQVNGKVDHVTLVRSLHADLDANAIAAAKKWRFKPGTRNGTPVPVVVTIQMTFTLK